MPRTTIDTPAAVVHALNDDGAILPPRTSCDVFSKPESKVQCMACNAPAMKRTEPLMVVVLMGATRHEQREAASVLQRLIGDDPDSLTGLRVLQSGGVTLMLAPWNARDLVRGVADAVSAGWHPERVTVDGARLDNEGVVVVPGPGSHGDLAVEIREALETFAADSGSLWDNARRLLSGRHEPKLWSLPLGCSVIERQEGRYICWDIAFENINKLEQAVELVETRLAMGKDHLLQRWTTNDEDAVETRLPSIMLKGPAHSREARAQVARLLQNTLFMIGRLGFMPSNPPALRKAAG
ncbi:MAG: hypothetical protein IBJ14_14745 [Hydrogenophaga sp.]|nr:hypothetical protein [Hydrogenophaga sp.]